jgi:translation elongation factor EF-1alpha
MSDRQIDVGALAPESINLAVLGASKAGKSMMSGRLACLLEAIPQ